MQIYGNKNRSSWLGAFCFFPHTHLARLTILATKACDFPTTPVQEAEKGVE